MMQGVVDNFTITPLVNTLLHIVHLTEFACTPFLQTPQGQFQ